MAARIEDQLDVFTFDVMWAARIDDEQRRYIYLLSGSSPHRVSNTNSSASEISTEKTSFESKVIPSYQRRDVRVERQVSYRSLLKSFPFSNRDRSQIVTGLKSCLPAYRAMLRASCNFTAVNKNTEHTMTKIVVDVTKII